MAEVETGARLLAWFVELIKSFKYETKSKMKLSLNQAVSIETIASMVNDGNITEILELSKINNVNVADILNIQIRKDSISQLEDSIKDKNIKKIN